MNRILVINNIMDYLLEDSLEKAELYSKIVEFVMNKTGYSAKQVNQAMIDFSSKDK